MQSWFFAKGMSIKGYSHKKMISISIANQDACASSREASFGVNAWFTSADDYSKFFSRAPRLERKVSRGGPIGCIADNHPYNNGVLVAAHARVSLYKECELCLREVSELCSFFIYSDPVRLHVLHIELPSCLYPSETGSRAKSAQIRPSIIYLQKSAIPNFTTIHII